MSALGEPTPRPEREREPRGGTKTDIQIVKEITPFQRDYVASARRFQNQVKAGETNFQWRGIQGKLYDTIIKDISHGHTRGYGVVPTGGGKTVLFGALTKGLNVAQNGEKTVIVVPKTGLVDQTIERLKEHFELDATRFDGKGKDISGNIIVTTYDSQDNLNKALRKAGEKVGLLMLDEAHRGLSDNRVAATEETPGNPITLAWTATDEFSDGRKVGDHLPREFFRLSLQDAVNHDMVCEADVGVIESDFDLSKLRRTSTGDFDDDALDEALILDHEAGIEDANQEALAKALTDPKLAGKKKMIFARTVNYSKYIAAYQKKHHGVKAAAIYGAMPEKEKAKILKDYEDGKIDVLICDKLLKEGSDINDIEVVINATPNGSLVDYMQGIGRGLRKHTFADGTEKRLLIIDTLFDGKTGLTAQDALGGVILEKERSESEGTGEEQIEEIEEEEESFSWGRGGGRAKTREEVQVLLEKNTNNNQVVDGRILQREMLRFLEANAFTPIDQLMARKHGIEVSTQKDGLSENNSVAMTGEKIFETYKRNGGKVVTSEEDLIALAEHLLAREEEREAFRAARRQSTALAGLTGNEERVLSGMVTGALLSDRNTFRLVDSFRYRKLPMGGRDVTGADVLNYYGIRTEGDYAEFVLNKFEGLQAENTLPQSSRVISRDLDYQMTKQALKNPIVTEEAFNMLKHPTEDWSTQTIRVDSRKQGATVRKVTLRDFFSAYAEENGLEVPGTADMNEWKSTLMDLYTERFKTDIKIGKAELPVTWFRETADIQVIGKATAQGKSLLDIASTFEGTLPSSLQNLENEKLEVDGVEIRVQSLVNLLAVREFNGNTTQAYDAILSAADGATPVVLDADYSWIEDEIKLKLIRQTMVDAIDAQELMKREGPGDKTRYYQDLPAPRFITPEMIPDDIMGKESPTFGHAVALIELHRTGKLHENPKIVRDFQATMNDFELQDIPRLFPKLQ